MTKWGMGLFSLWSLVDILQTVDWAGSDEDAYPLSFPNTQTHIHIHTYTISTGCSRIMKMGDAWDSDNPNLTLLEYPGSAFKVTNT